MHPPRSGHQPAARGYGFTPALVRQQLLAPTPPPPNLHAQHQARASARYHDQLRVTELAPGIRPYVARQDGPIALQAQAGAHAQRQYHGRNPARRAPNRGRTEGARPRDVPVPGP